MTATSERLRVVLHYDARGLFVRAEQLGVELAGDFDGHSVRVLFPDAEGCFPEQPAQTPTALSGSRMGEEGPAQLIAVKWVQVTVDMGEALDPQPDGNRRHDLIRDTDALGTSAVRQLLDWAAAHDRQVWLAPIHERPALHQHAWILNGADRLDTYGPLRPSVIVMQSPEHVAGMGDLSRLAGVIPPSSAASAELLLAEAHWAVWPAVDPDPRRGVLYAAIALEVKAPEALRAATTSEKLPLVDLMLRSHEDVPTSVNFQLNHIAAEVLGEGLKQSDGALAKRIVSLFKLRNDVAHRGMAPDLTEARKAILSARDVFDWLDGHVRARQAHDVPS